MAKAKLKRTPPKRDSGGRTVGLKKDKPQSKGKGKGKK